MPKTSLEMTIDKVASDFASEIIAAVKTATLQELLSLQGRSLRGKPGPKPGSRKKAGRGRAATAIVKKTRKKRVVKNYPKCAYPKCGKNRFPRGKGFCGDHWRKLLEGKIKEASHYKGKEKK